MEQIKLAFSRAISYCLAALIALLSIGPFAPRVTVQEPLTTQSKFLIYEVRAVALMGEPIHFQLEQAQDGNWIRLEIRPDYAVYGEGVRTIPLLEPYRKAICLEGAFGHRLACGRYRLTIYESWDYSTVGSVCFSVTESSDNQNP